MSENGRRVVGWCRGVQKEQKGTNKPFSILTRESNPRATLSDQWPPGREAKICGVTSLSPILCAKHTKTCGLKQLIRNPAS